MAGLFSVATEIIFDTILNSFNCSLFKERTPSLNFTFSTPASDTFYVEMLYDSRSNEIKKIKSFRTDKLLKPYLSQIKLKDIPVIPKK